METILRLGLDPQPPVRSIIFEASISLDGFIAGPDGEKDWMVAGDEDTFDNEVFMENFDTIFFGRKAYEEMALQHFSLTLLDEPEREFYYLWYGMRKYVFSRRETHVKGNGMVVRGNLEEEVNRIRGEEGKNILFCGGAEIFSTFAELDLIDDYVLTVHPVMLGAGKSLFRRDKKPLNLKLMGNRILRSGVTILHYKPANRINSILL